MTIRRINEGSGFSELAADASLALSKNDQAILIGLLHRNPIRTHPELFLIVHHFAF